MFAGGGLNATPNDLARFAVMMLDNGKFNGQQVVDPAVIKQLSDGGNIDAFSNGPASANKYDEFNINAFDVIIGYLTKQ